MRLWKKAVTALMAACLCLTAADGTLYAKGTPYTYTVTFYSGTQGKFVNANGLSVSGGQGEVSVSAEKITVSGLKSGDIVSFNPQGGALELEENGKYYIRGVRESGRDNSTVSASAFLVSADSDYVAAYGIQGNTVAYTVNYHDEDGNALAESSVYYGNVGDKPVVAYLYIDGYTPQALAQTKTLSDNATENVFTFVYVQNETEEGVEPEVPQRPEGTQTNRPVTIPAAGGGTSGGTDSTAAGTGGTGTGGTAAGTGGAGTAGTAAGTDTGTAAADGAEGPAGGQEGDIADDAADIENQVVPDDEVPLTNQPLVDLDDDENEKVPTASQNLVQEELQKGLPLAAYAGIGVAAAAALFAMVFILRRRRKTVGNIKRDSNENGKANK